MKKINNILLIALILLSSAIQAATLEGRVVGVADGDTITILDAANSQYKIRLAGIDAPEKKQPFGNVSKKSLSDLVFGKQVTIDYSKQDRYGRVVGKVRVDGSNVNLEQIRRGMAWHYKKYKTELVLDDRLAYLHAQEDARKAGLGLWIDQSPIPPWDFRKSKKFPTVVETSNTVEETNRPAVIKRSAINLNDNATSNSDHCYNLVTDAQLLECLN